MLASFLFIFTHILIIILYNQEGFLLCEHVTNKAFEMLNQADVTNHCALPLCDDCCQWFALLLHSKVVSLNSPLAVVLTVRSLHIYPVLALVFLQQPKTQLRNLEITLRCDCEGLSLCLPVCLCLQGRRSENRIVPNNICANLLALSVE